MLVIEVEKVVRVPVIDRAASRMQMMIVDDSDRVLVVVGAGSRRSDRVDLSKKVRIYRFGRQSCS